MVIKLNSTYFYITLLLILGVFSSNIIQSKSSDSISFSLFGQTKIPDRIYPKRTTSQLLAVEKPEMYYSFGLTIGKTNSFYGIKLDYGSFLEGQRTTLSVQFMHRSIISPYIGLTYISNIDRVIIIKRKPYELQGYDGMLGVSVALLNMFKLNAEYTINTSIWFLGGSFHIPLQYQRVNNKSKITFDFGNNK